MNEETEKHLERLGRLAYVMENLIPVPGTKIRLGVDAIAGFVPVVGDAVTLIPASYIVHSAYKMGAPRRMLIRMGLNLAVDFAFGVVPILGDIFDAGWNANTRNVALLKSFTQQKAAREAARTALECDGLAA
jgi:hypothetical protein